MHLSTPWHASNPWKYWLFRLHGQPQKSMHFSNKKIRGLDSATNVSTVGFSASADDWQKKEKKNNRIRLKLQASLRRPYAHGIRNRAIPITPVFRKKNKKKGGVTLTSALNRTWRRHDVVWSYPLKLFLWFSPWKNCIFYLCCYILQFLIWVLEIFIILFFLASSLA